MERPRLLLPMLSLTLLSALSTAQAEPAQQIREGRIRDVLGEPIVGARVEARRDGRIVARSASDAEGIYSLRVPHDAELRFTADGREAAALPVGGELAPRVHHVVLEEAARVRGTVRDDAGAPAAAVAILLLTGDRSQCTLTDGNGAFELSAVPLRAATLFARGPAGSCERTLHVREDCSLDLVLEPQRHAGCVVRVQGLPQATLAGAALRVFGPEPVALRGAQLALRPDGTAALPFLRMGLVQVIADGFIGQPNAQVVGPDSKTLTFTMAPLDEQRLTVVRGHLRTTLDRALGNVRVFVRDRSHRDLGAVTTGRDGGFRLPLSLGGDHGVRLGIRIHDGWLADDHATVHDNCTWQLGSAGGDAIELLVEPSVPVQTTVRLQDGTVLALADLVVGDPQRPHRTLLHLHTDRAGSASFGLPFGRHELLAISYDGTVCRATVDVRTGGSDAPQWQRVATGEIAGTLRLPDGSPLPGVELLLAHEDLQREGAANSSERQRVTVVTDRGGSFRCRGVPIGGWTLVGLHDAAVANDACFVASDTRSVVELRRAR